MPDIYISLMSGIKTIKVTFLDKSMISQNSEDSYNSDDNLSEKIRETLRRRSLINAIKENNYLEDIAEHLRGIHPDWSICEINKQARYLKNRADRYS